MDSLFGKLKGAADQAGSAASAAQEKILQEYLPTIVSALQEKAGPAVLDILSDVDRFSEIARSAYQALPMPVRILVKEQNFIDWAVSRQDSILEKLRTQVSLGSACETVAPARNSDECVENAPGD